MDAHVIVEWAPFTLREGVDEAQLIAASEALQSGFLAQQRGFIRRELLKGQNGQWVDLVIWEGKDAADEAAKNAAESPVCYKYFQVMDADHSDPGAGVLHFERIRVYER